MGLRDRAAQAVENDDKDIKEEKQRSWRKNAITAEHSVKRFLTLEGKTTHAYEMSPEEMGEDYRKTWNTGSRMEFGWGDGSIVEVFEEDISLTIKVSHRSELDRKGVPTVPMFRFFIRRINGDDVSGTIYRVTCLADVGRAISHYDERKTRKGE